MSTVPSSTKPPSTRFYWRVVIVVLWMIAGIALTMTVMQRYQAAKPKVDSVSKEKPIDLRSKGAIAVNPQPPEVDAWDEEGIKDFNLIDANGQPVTKKDLLGKPWAVCFIFTQCQFSCPAITQTMQLELQDRLKGVDVRLISLTVDPKNDTPAKLLAYSKQYDADPQKWWFLTGKKEEIFTLIRGSFKKGVKDTDGPVGFQVAHSNHILHVDANGVVQGKYDGTDPVDVARLRNALKKEAKEILNKKKQTSPPPLVAPLP